jgi:hypothetical protein
MAIVAVLIIAAALRRVVPTNMVHIVQSSKKTTPYGRDKPAGNTYYQFPEWIPRFGVSVSKFPESNFQVNLADYEAYDQKRLPFVVSVTAFFFALKTPQLPLNAFHRSTSWWSNWKTSFKGLFAMSWPIARWKTSCRHGPRWQSNSQTK